MRFYHHVVVWIILLVLVIGMVVWLYHDHSDKKHDDVVVTNTQCPIIPVHHQWRQG